MGNDWSQGQKLGPEVNNGNGNSDPYISPDGKMLYYSQDHAPGILMIPVNIPAFFKLNDFGNGYHDLYRAAVLLGGLINFIKECDIRSASPYCWYLYFYCLLSFVYGSIRYFVGINDADLLKAVGIFLQITNI